MNMNSLVRIYGRLTTAALSGALLLVVCTTAHEVIRRYSDPLGWLAEIMSDYQVELVLFDLPFPVTTSSREITGERASNTELESYARLFAREFALYPPDLVKRSKLRRVVFCEHLSTGGPRIGGVWDPEHETIYLDVGVAAGDKSRARNTIHHEFYHAIDSHRGTFDQDDRWEMLNPPGFKYGGGGHTAWHQPKTLMPTDKYPGFLNHYSTTAVGEDKAELFAHLVTSYAYVEQRAWADPVLRAKAQRMKELLADFCPEVNERFWKKAKALKRVGT
jgi:hypothetical protein